MVYSNRWDFGPRIGFAYRIAESSRPTVLRGGYAIYAIPDRLRDITERTREIVPTTPPFTNNPNDAQQSPDGKPNYLLRSVPEVIAGANSKDVLDLATVTGITRAVAKFITSIRISPRRALMNGTSPWNERSLQTPASD